MTNKGTTVQSETRSNFTLNLKHDNRKDGQGGSEGCVDGEKEWEKGRGQEKRREREKEGDIGNMDEATGGRERRGRRERKTREEVERKQHEREGREDR